MLTFNDIWIICLGVCLGISSYHLTNAIAKFILAYIKEH